MIYTERNKYKDQVEIQMPDKVITKIKLTDGKCIA